MPRSALHQIDVFDGDRTAIAEEYDQHSKTDRRFGGGDGENQQRENLADDVVKEGRERHEVDVDRKQDQLDRHQNDDDVLAVDEDAEDAEREQDRGDREIVPQTDGHSAASRGGASASPCPGA